MQLVSGLDRDGVFETYPDINRMVETIGEKRFLGLPSFASLPPEIVVRGGTRPDQELWWVEDQWFGIDQDPREISVELRIGNPFGKMGEGAGHCGGFAILKLDDLAGVFVPANIEKARLLLTVNYVDRDLCAVFGSGYPVPFTHASRIPQPDTLPWSFGQDLNWDDFVAADDALGNEPSVFHHPDADHGGIYDFALKFMASGAREFEKPPTMIDPKILYDHYGSSETEWPYDRSEVFDLTAVTRHWAGDDPEDPDRNNGLFLQAYLPTRGYEPQVLFRSSDDSAHRPWVRPLLAVYENEYPEPKGAPFGFFYEALGRIDQFPGDNIDVPSIRVYELAHREDLVPGETWLLIINISEALTECVRLYSNRHDPPPSIEAISAITGNWLPLSGVQNAEYINYGGLQTYITCPDTPAYSPDMWWPDPPEAPDPYTYQPISRWKLDIPTAHGDNGVLLVKIEHP